MYAKWNRFLGVFVTPNIGKLCMSKNDPFWTPFGPLFNPFFGSKYPINQGEIGVSGGSKKGSKKGQKRVKNGSKKGSKRGLKSREMVPKMVPNWVQTDPIFGPP